jgi:hypothetical protein
MKQIAKCIMTQSLLFPEMHQKQHEILDDKVKPTTKCLQEDDKSKGVGQLALMNNSSNKIGDMELNYNKDRKDESTSIVVGVDVNNHDTSRRSSPRRSSTSRNQVALGKSQQKTNDNHAEYDTRMVNSETASDGRDQSKVEDDDNDHFHDTHEEDVLSVDDRVDCQKEKQVPQRMDEEELGKLSTYDKENKNNFKQKQPPDAAGSIISKRSRKIKNPPSIALTEEGWMRAMPKNQGERQALMRSNKEIRSATGFEVIRDVVPTEKVEGLVVAVSNCSNSVQQQSNNYAHKISSQYDNIDPVIRFRLVLPKEPDNQRDLAGLDFNIKQMPKLRKKLVYGRVHQKYKQEKKCEARTKRKCQLIAFHRKWKRLLASPEKDR